MITVKEVTSLATVQGASKENLETALTAAVTRADAEIIDMMDEDGKYTVGEVAMYGLTMLYVGAIAMAMAIDGEAEATAHKESGD